MFAMAKDVKGVTLLGLMIAVSLGVILLGIGAPAMSSLLSENSLRFESRTLLKYLRFARSQAIDNQQSVTACLANASDNCVTANPTQLLVFVDNDAPADNILNKEYKEYTNRSRYYAHDMGRDVRCGVSWSF